MKISAPFCLTICIEMMGRTLSTLLLSALVAGTPGIVAAERPNMSLVDYLARKQHLSVELRTAQLACGASPSTQREICLAEAVGVDWVAKSDLEVAYRSTPRSRCEASEARAQAKFWLARERCADAAELTRQACFYGASETLRAALLVARAQMSAEEAAQLTAALCTEAAKTAAQRRVCTREAAAAARQAARGN